jgi:hypothetical protein
VSIGCQIVSPSATDMTFPVMVWESESVGKKTTGGVEFENA